MKILRRIRHKQAYNLSDQELAYVVKLFYNAQLKYPNGLNSEMKGAYLNTCITDICRESGISEEMMRDVLMILFKRGVLLVKYDVDQSRTVSVRAGSNALVFIQTSLEVKREQRWTRWLAVVAILISMLALGAQIGESLGWFNSEPKEQPPRQALPALSPSAADTPSYADALSGAKPIP